MRTYIKLLFLVLISAGAVSAQSKSNDAINKQIKELNAGKAFTLTYDKSSGMSKLMATSENFSDADSKKAGIQAMSFGMAYFYQGQALTKSADTIAITFWVMSKKPRFAAKHNWQATVGRAILNLGDAQYAARAGENMEYLNYKISRTSFEHIAVLDDVSITLGDAHFNFTPAQLKLFRDFLKLTDHER